jgi:CBS domain-containing membrane protein
LGLPVVASAILAASLAVAAMGLLRATHPPGGAVALALVLAAQPPDLWFWAGRVVLGSCLLVAVGVFWNPMTGRLYPFRHAKG